MFTKVYLPANITQHVRGKILESINRNKIFKKRTQLGNVFAVKQNVGARCVFISIKHPEQGDVLVFLKTFLSFQHKQYEQYLQTMEVPAVTDFSAYVQHDLVTNDQRSGGGAAAGPTPSGSKGVRLRRGRDGPGAGSRSSGAVTGHLDALAESHQASHQEGAASEEVDVRVLYRGETLQPSQIQEAFFDKIDAPVSESTIRCITGGAGSGKTLLAERALINFSTQYQQLIYVSPNHQLANRMLESLRVANVTNVICLSLDQFDGSENGFETFQAFFTDTKKNPIATYQSVCQLAALQYANVSEGNIYDKLKGNIHLLTNYKKWIQDRNKADFRVGIGFPWGLLTASDYLIVDEFQQIPYPLLREFNEFPCHQLFLGDNNQAIDDGAHISLHYFSKNFPPEHLSTTFRVPKFVAGFANAVLSEKAKRFNQRQNKRLNTTDEKSGNIFWCERKTLAEHAIQLSINTAVVCLEEAELDWTIDTLGEANVYRPREILGLEFDNIMLVVSNQFLKMLNSKPGPILRATALVNNSADLTLYNSLYVALTRVKHNLCIVVDNPTLAQSVFEAYEVNAKNERLDASAVEAHFGNMKLSPDIIAKYIDNEVKNGTVKRAEQLFSQYVSHPGGFIMYCVNHGIDLSLVVDKSRYHEAIFRKAEELIGDSSAIVATFSATANVFLTEQQSLLIERYANDRRCLQLISAYSAVENISGLSTIIRLSTSPDIKEAACHEYMRLFPQQKKSFIESPSELVLCQTACLQITPSPSEVFIDSVLSTAQEILKNTQLQHEQQIKVIAMTRTCVTRIKINHQQFNKIVELLLTTINSRQEANIRSEVCKLLVTCMNSKSFPELSVDVLYRSGHAVLQYAGDNDNARANALLCISRCIRSGHKVHDLPFLFQQACAVLQQPVDHYNAKIHGLLFIAYAMGKGLPVQLADLNIIYREAFTVLQLVEDDRDLKRYAILVIENVMGRGCEVPDLNSIYNASLAFLHQAGDGYTKKIHAFNVISLIIGRGFQPPDLDIIYRASRTVIQEAEGDCTAMAHALIPIAYLLRRGFLPPVPDLNSIYHAALAVLGQAADDHNALDHALHVISYCMDMELLITLPQSVIIFCAALTVLQQTGDDCNLKRYAINAISYCMGAECPITVHELAIISRAALAYLQKAGDDDNTKVYALNIISQCKHTPITDDELNIIYHKSVDFLQKPGDDANAYALTAIAYVLGKGFNPPDLGIIYGEALTVIQQAGDDDHVKSHAFHVISYCIDIGFTVPDFKSLFRETLACLQKVGGNYTFKRLALIIMDHCIRAPAVIIEPYRETLRPIMELLQEHQRTHKRAVRIIELLDADAEVLPLPAITAAPTL